MQANEREISALKAKRPPHVEGKKKKPHEVTLLQPRQSSEHASGSNSALSATLQQPTGDGMRKRDKKKKR